ncbi:cytochrome P450 [Nostoc sp. FACHB-87]|uniref:cytochrome P450 n=1 Tax=Nostocaceae TaxID=1162 RepID=UPI001689DC83|nr:MULTISPECIES: cytochrome P450 [Nostocaceae]MBD2303557.1 cytochrome P450 [Nostoc sp. FACHB-190]MBD2458019.1 cytochrome P450 [Nostoc sp. FACHB-87]MBD2479204.1 cytochrome P450 [Anabaena sp. FACHB-83]
MSKDVFELSAPPVNSIVGHLLELGQDPLGFLSRCRDYGDIIPLQLGLTPACLVTNPDYIEEVLKNRHDFIKSRGLRSLKTLLGEGLLTTEGESWFWQRRLAQPVFHQKRINGYSQIMVDYANQMLQTWNDGEIRDIHAEMMQLTLEIVMKCIFSAEVDAGEAKVVANALDVAMNWFESKRKQNFLVWEWFPRPENINYRRAITAMNEAIYQLIQERRHSQKKTHDLLSMLMEAKDEQTGQQMDDKLLRDEVATLMLAGHETTANTLSWTWMLLAQNPEVREKLKSELDQVLQGKLPTLEDLSKLVYTQQVIKESMRLYPPVSLMGREAAVDTQIGDYEIPQGTSIMISQWVMHRHPKYFENPEAFQPERWTEELDKQLPKGVYFPFGDGPRICIGKGFAQMEAALLLATIAQSFQIDLVPGHSIVPQPSITLRPENGLKVEIKSLREREKVTGNR